MGHYQQVAASYESAFFYASGPYQDWLLHEVAQRLHLDHPRLRVADVGGGTGNFSQELADHAQLATPVLCVDNSPDMLAAAVQRPGVQPVCADALTFATSAGQCYDRALLKEVVHHLPAADVTPMYAGLAKQLTPGGVCCTVTRPQEVDYPLFEAARGVWRDKQPAVADLEAAMRAAGFCDVTVETATYRAVMPKQRWFAMVRDRFWSTFSNFSDDELAAGIAELEARFAGQEDVVFNDRLLFLIGRSPDARKAQFAQSGVLLRQRLLSQAEAATAYEELRKYDWATGQRRFKAHLLLPWLWDLVLHPAIVSAACAALDSQSVACWSTDIFAKRAKSGSHTLWHQDSTYVAMQPPDSVTVWLALTPSGPSNGGLYFLPDSHAHGQRPHERRLDDANNMLLAGQGIVADDASLAEADAQAVTCDLEPGEATIHHLLTIHRSGPNEHAEDRVGIALRFMAASVKQDRQPRDSVTVVAGPSSAFETRYELERSPREGHDAQLAWERAVAAVVPDAGKRNE